MARAGGRAVQDLIRGGRLGQLLSNLLVNAVTHGSGEQPVRVLANAADGRSAARA